MFADFNVPYPHWKDPNDPIALKGFKVTVDVILFSCKDTDHNPQGGGVIFACLYGAPS
jgi:hypothetical protein